MDLYNSIALCHTHLSGRELHLACFKLLSCSHSQRILVHIRLAARSEWYGYGYRYAPPLALECSYLRAREWLMQLYCIEGWRCLTMQASNELALGRIEALAASLAAMEREKVRECSLGGGQGGPALSCHFA